MIAKTDNISKRFPIVFARVVVCFFELGASNDDEVLQRSDLNSTEYASTDYLTVDVCSLSKVPENIGTFNELKAPSSDRVDVHKKRVVQVLRFATKTVEPTPRFF